MISYILCVFLCLFHIINLGECVVTDKEYAKLPPVFEQDGFDRCMLLEDEALYCSMEFHLKPIDSKNPSKAWQNIQELNANPNNYHHDNLRHGICVPFACPNISTSYKDPRFKDELAKCYSKKYKKDGLYGTIGYMHCQTTEPIPFDFYDHIVAIVLVIYIVFIVYASLYEGVARYKPKEEYEKITGTMYGKILSSFSITRNWIRLKTVHWTPELKAMKAIQGVRVHNMLLVITCHACMMAVLGPVTNTQYVEHAPDHPMAILLGSGPYGVEGFFIISSWMVTYYIFKNFNEQSERELNIKTLFRIFLYRYIRLTIPLAVMIILHSTLIYHASTGPWWDLLVGRDRISCRENGWTNLLYINNLISPSKMCIVETWYTGVDMHGFLLDLAILYFTVKKPQRLWWIIPSVWLLIQTVHLKSLYDNDIYTFFPPTAENMYGIHGIFHGREWIQTLAITRANMPGTLVGLVVGYVCYKYENEEFILTKYQTVLWWLLSFGMGVSIVVFPGLWIFSKHYYPSMWFSLPYFAFNTTIFGIAVGIVLFGFTKGIGWMAKWCVEWKPLYILGRLTYSAFLVHYTVGILEVGSYRYPYHMNAMTVIFETMLLLTASFFFALILAMTVELPVTSLQSMFLKRNSQTEIKQDKNDSDGRTKESQRLKKS